MNRPSRILMVSEPGEFGVLIYVRNLIRFLHQRHPEIGVDLAYSSRRGSGALEELIREVEARGGETLDLKVGNAPEAADLRALREVRKLIRRRRPGLVHAHSSKAGALMRLNAMLPGSPPVVYSPHGYYGMARRGGLKERLFNAMETGLGRIGWTHHVSAYERRFARTELGLPRKTVLVHTGIDLGTFRPADPARKRAARLELKLPGEGKLLVTLGREAYEKNLDPLYGALDRLLPGADWWFAHAGARGEFAARLGEAARRRMFLFPYLPKPSLLLEAADGFILPSRTEAFGLAAYEALCCGLPLILTASTGLLSLRRPEFPGIRWLPDPATAGDIEPQIVEAIGTWARAEPVSPQRQAALAARGFDEKRQFEKLVRLYGRVK